MFAAAVLLPMVLTTGYSFTEWNGFGPMTWVGLDNYVHALNDRAFVASFGHVLVYIAATLVLEVHGRSRTGGARLDAPRRAVVPGRDLHAR